MVLKHRKHNNTSHYQYGNRNSKIFVRDTDVCKRLKQILKTLIETSLQRDNIDYIYPNMDL